MTSQPSRDLALTHVCAGALQHKASAASAPWRRPGAAPVAQRESKHEGLLKGPLPWLNIYMFRCVGQCLSCSVPKPRKIANHSGAEPSKYKEINWVLGKGGIHPFQLARAIFRIHGTNRLHPSNVCRAAWPDSFATPPSFHQRAHQGRPANGLNQIGKPASLTVPLFEDMQYFRSRFRFQRQFSGATPHTHGSSLRQHPEGTGTSLDGLEGGWHADVLRGQGLATGLVQEGVPSCLAPFAMIKVSQVP